MIRTMDFTGFKHRLRKIRLMLLFEAKAIHLFKTGIIPRRQFRRDVYIFQCGKTTLHMILIAN